MPILSMVSLVRETGRGPSTYAEWLSLEVEPRRGSFLIVDVSLQLRSLARTMLFINANPAQGWGLRLSWTGTSSEPVKSSG